MEDSTDLAQGQNSEVESAGPAAPEDARERQDTEKSASDAEPAPKSPAPAEPAKITETAEMDEPLDVSGTGSDVLSNMADSLANLAESSPGLSANAIRKMATTLYALAQSDTTVANQALEKMADSLAGFEPGAEDKPASSEGGVEETSEEAGQEPAQVEGEVAEMTEEAPITETSIAEIIATTCDPPPATGDESELNELNRQAEALTSLVSQEDIVRIANSLAELAGSQEFPASADVSTETEANTVTAEGAEEEDEGTFSQMDSAMSTVDINLASLVSKKPNLRKRAAKVESATATPAHSALRKSDIQAPSPKRRSYDADFKLEVVAYAARTSKNEASRRYMVDRKRIQDWTKQKDALQASLHTGVRRKRLEGGGRKAQHPVIEEQLADWVRSRWAEKETVTREMIKREARRLHQESSGVDPFSASEGWLCRFMQRHEISLRSPSQSPGKTKSPAGRTTRTAKDVVSVQLPWIIDLEPAASSSS